MEEFAASYGYLGISLTIIGSGLGLPIPEEIPVVMGGILVGHEDTSLRWWIMLPLIIASIVIGDGFLYAIGRLWGPRLIEYGWIKRHVIKPEKREEITKNFHDRGIAVLLAARLMPGIRTPVFIMAGVLRFPLGRFLLADGLYAIPGVNIIFWLAYSLTDQVLEVVKRIEAYRPLVMVAVLSAVAGALVYKYLGSRRMSSGNPEQLPNIISKPGEMVGHAIEKTVETTIEKPIGMTVGAIDKVMHPSGPRSSGLHNSPKNPPPEPPPVNQPTPG